MFCSGSDISTEVPPVDVKVRTTVDLSSRQIFSPVSGDIFRGHQMRDQKWLRVDHSWPLRHRVLPFDSEYLKKGKSKRYM